MPIRKSTATTTTTAYSIGRFSRQEAALMLPQNNSPSLEAMEEEDGSRNKIGGADMLEEDTDGTATASYNAFHLACVADNLECVKLLLERGVLGDLNRKFCGYHGDYHDGLLTALCCAVSCRNVNVVQILVESGVDVEVSCGPLRSSPLHWAAGEEDNGECLQILLKAGASHWKRDAKGQTALHVAAGVNDLDGLRILLDAGADPNVVDGTGRTSLHCAVAKGSKRVVECVRLLLETGRVDINAQDEYGYSALHLSAVNENAKCTSLLLQNGADTTLKTSGGTTALSMLVRKMPDLMNHLIKRLDSGITIHDNDAADANCQLKMDFSVLIPQGSKKRSVKKRSKKVADDGGEGGDGGNQPQQQQPRRRKETELLTCLVSTGNKKLLAHPLSEAFLLLKWRRVRKFFLASLLFQMALVALFTIFVVEVYLKRCPYQRPAVEDDGGDVASQDNHRISRRSAYPTSSDGGGGDGGFSWFRVVPKKKKKADQNPPHYSPPPAPQLPPQIPPPMMPSTTYAPSTRAPPFREIWRNQDNRSRARLPSSSFAPSAAPPPPPAEEDEDGGTVGYSGLEDIDGDSDAGLSSSETAEDKHVPGQQEKDATDATATDSTHKCSLNLPLTGIWYLLVISITLLTLQEIFQLVHGPYRYLVSSENLVQWLLIVTVLITSWIGRSTNLENSREFTLEYWQYPTAACGILIAWGLILFQVGRFPSLGLYVEMLGKVAQNFGLFISAYACLLIAFALSFCVLFPEEPSFSSVPLSILKVFTMMVGEVDYEDLFYSEERSHDPLIFPLTVHLIFGAFVLIMTIVLMNLLVGLAVSDIQGLQKGAKLDRLTRQTALIARFESFIFSKRLQSILPSQMVRMVQETSLLAGTAGVEIDPDSTRRKSVDHPQMSFYFCPNDPRDRTLPKDIKTAALRVVTSSSSSKHRVPLTPSPKMKAPEKNGRGIRRSISSVSHHYRERQQRYLEHKSDSNQSSASTVSFGGDGRPSPPARMVSFGGTLEVSEEERLKLVETRLEKVEKGVDKILELLLASQINSASTLFTANENCGAK